MRIKKLICVCMALLCTILPCLQVHAKPVQFYSSNIIMIHMKNQQVVFEQEADEKIYPGSMTKIMTALLVIENTRHFDKQITISKNDLRNLEEEHASIAGFQVGEQVSVLDALHGTMLPSGGDAARAVARHMCGSESEFVKLMNAKAKALGMEHTHFTNPVGFHDEQHYSTARDMAILFSYAMKNEQFQAIASCKEYHVNSNVHDDLGFNHSVYYTLQENHIESDYLIGLKSGYTTEGGLCLASMAQKGEDTYLIVSAGANREENIIGNLLDMDALYQYYFNHQTSFVYKKEQEDVGSITLGFLKRKQTVATQKELMISLDPSIHVEEITWEFQPVENRFFIDQGDVVGRIQASYQGDIMYEGTVLSGHRMYSYEVLLMLFFVVVGLLTGGGLWIRKHKSK